MITEAEAISTIETPDFTEPSVKGSVKGRINSYKYLGNRYLRITCKRESSGDFVVITAVARKKPFENVI